MKFLNYVWNKYCLFVEYVINTCIEIGNKNMDKFIEKFNKDMETLKEKPTSPPPKPRGRPKKNTEFKVKILKDGTFEEVDLVDFLKRYNK